MYPLKYLLQINLLFFVLYSNAVMSAEHWNQQNISLAKLMTVDEQINLKNINDFYDFTYAVSNHVKVEKVILHLNLTHSTLLIKERSQLVILVNDIVAGQIRLTSQNGHIVKDIELPAEYFIEGYNKITLSVSQHYTLQCEIPRSPELWTQVNSVKSGLTITMSDIYHDYTLADLNKIFDKKLQKYNVILIHPSGDYSDKDLQLGSLIAQGIALRLEFRTFSIKLQKAKATTQLQREKYSNHNPLRFLQQSELTSDSILIGTVKELSEFLSPDLKHKINNAYLGIYSAHNKNRKIIVISGETDEQVRRAAITFAYARNNFPDSYDMLIEKIDLPVYIDNTRIGEIISGETYQFQDLGFFDQTINNKSKNIALTFNMPSDLYHEPKKEVNLNLNLNYGSAFRADSVLNIRVNGTFERAILLDNQDGDIYKNYKINIPSDTFIPGFNEINFEAVMPPAVSGECTYIQTKNSLLTLFSSSSISFPKLDHYTQLPDLSLLKRTGFPYLKGNKGAELGIVIRDHNKASLIAAWTLVAKLSQLNKAPLPEAKLSFRSINNRHLFIIGQRRSLYDDDLANAPVKMKDIIKFPYSASVVAKPIKKSLWNYIEEFLFPEVQKSKTISLENLHADASLISNLGQQTIMVSYPNKNLDQRVNTLITYDDSQSFQDNIYKLVQPEVWNKLNNNIAIWKNKKDSLETLKSGSIFYIGKTSIRNKFAYYFLAHRIYWVLIIMGLVLLLAFIVHRILNRFKLKHHGSVTEYDS